MDSQSDEVVDKLSEQNSVMRILLVSRLKCYNKNIASHFTGVILEGFPCTCQAPTVPAGLPLCYRNPAVLSESHSTVEIPLCYWSPAVLPKSCYTAGIRL